MNLGILGYHLVGPGVPVKVHSRSCTPMYWYVQVPVVSLYRISWVPAAAATASAGPPAAGDLEIEIVSCLNGHENRYTYKHEGVRAPSVECGCGHAVGAYISLIADHRRLLIFSFFHCIHNASFVFKCILKYRNCVGEIRN